MKIVRMAAPENLHHTGTTHWYIIGVVTVLPEARALGKILIDQNTINTLLTKETVRGYICSYIFQPMFFHVGNVSDYESFLEKWFKVSDRVHNLKKKVYPSVETVP